MSLKDLLDTVNTRVQAIEEHNQKLLEALSSLLNEDDVKELPAYELLRMTYEPYLTAASAPSVKASGSGAHAAVPEFDPLHAPPSSRYGAKKSISINPKRPLVGIKEPAHTPAPETSPSHYSSEMPDMDSCILGEAPKTKKTAPAAKKKLESSSQVVASIASLQAIKIKPKSEETVYRVEIKGQSYYRYNEHIYDQNKKRIGTVSDFNLGSETPVELTEIPGFPDYYIHDTTVYILVNGKVAQAVGTYEDDELALWS